MKSIRIIDRLFMAGAVFSLVSMIIVVGVQVFFRFFIESTPHWTEEAARIFFIYSVAFGTGTGIRNGDFISLDLIGRYLSSKKNRLLQIITDVSVILFSIIIGVSSIRFVGYGLDESSPALEISMGIVFFSMVIISLGIAIFTFEHLLRLIRGEKTDLL
ncbi:MAG: TRAP transporter small permease [Bacteroidales bacterium]